MIHIEYENLSQNRATKGDRLQHYCPVCPYVTSRSSHLKRHIMTHTGERPFVCSVCNYRCNQKENLKKHMFTHKQ